MTYKKVKKFGGDFPISGNLTLCGRKQKNEKFGDRFSTSGIFTLWRYKNEKSLGGFSAFRDFYLMKGEKR